MNVNTYNQKGEEIGQTRLPKEVFDVKLNPDLLHQVIVSQSANRRQGTVQTKDRSEVRGGGKKPWRQKGTGRARHGSIRSPIWVGGGATFGPRKEKNYKKIIPEKMRKEALLMVLSSKAKQKFLIVLENLKIDKIKTKEIAEIFKNLKCQGQSILLAIKDKNIFLSARNIEKVKVIEPRNLNALDVLSCKYLITTKEGIKEIEKTFIGNSKFKNQNAK